LPVRVLERRQKAVDHARVRNGRAASWIKHGLVGGAIARAPEGRTVRRGRGSRRRAHHASRPSRQYFGKRQFAIFLRYDDDLRGPCGEKSLDRPAQDGFTRHKSPLLGLAWACSGPRAGGDDHGGKGHGGCLVLAVELVQSIKALLRCTMCLKTWRYGDDYKMSNKLEVGGVEVPGRVWIAPMTGVSDLPFRETATALGAPYVATEMVACAEFARGRPDVVRRAAVGEGCR
jgi:hypothetical protein